MTHSYLPPTEALQAVLIAAETGSFTAAADRMNITHGTISRRIAAVEHWAGLSLFTRHGRGVRLTLEGQRLAARLEMALAMIGDGRAASPPAPDLPVIRVGVVQSFARLWLIPNLARLEGDPPDLRIEPEIDNRPMTLSDARIAIRLGPGGWPGVLAEPLMREALQPVAAPGLAARLGGTADATRLLDHPLLHDATVGNWQDWFNAQGKTYSPRPRDRILSGHDLVLGAARAGLGIALARHPYSGLHPSDGGLVAVHPARVPATSAFHIVTRPGPRHPAVDRLVRRLRGLVPTP